MTSLFRPAGSLVDETDPIRLTPEEAGWDWCGLRVVELAAGQSRRIELGEAEAAVVPLMGSCHVETVDAAYELEGRTDVFSGLTDLCFLPQRSTMTIRSTGGGRFCVATSRAT
ncbi:MAG: 5-deoxy-glucuronate isomerase, partial [Acidimicrobiia bacterium]|nr:5-deoxy-glucuronate isomerase [Acidimicrobiia bacterium]